jgi:hypothetical protein
MTAIDFFSSGLSFSPSVRSNFATAGDHRWFVGSTAMATLRNAHYELEVPKGMQTKKLAAQSAHRSEHGASTSVASTSPASKAVTTAVPSQKRKRRQIKEKDSPDETTELHQGDEGEAAQSSIAERVKRLKRVGTKET